jgi:beta-lactamase class A
LLGAKAQNHVKFLGTFSSLERALTIGGLAPIVLLGCGVHEIASSSAASTLPRPGYRSLLPIPAPVPRAPAPSGLANAIEELRNRFDGLAGIAVRSVEDGWAIDSVDADRRMPQQSVSKLWVAMTVLDAVDQGRIRLNDPIMVTNADLTLFHQPVAYLVKGDGYRTTVADLFKRAMTQSDNTANDRLLTAVGGPGAVRAFIASRGLGNIRFGPGERLLQSYTAGLSWQQSYATGGGFQAARSRLSPDVRRAAYQRYVADPIDGAAPAAIADALARLKRGVLLSPESTNYLLATMAASRTGRARMRGAMPPGWILAHKTGTGQDLFGRTAGFNDVGLLTAPDGRTYALAIMVGDTARPPRDRQLLMQSVVSTVVANHRPGFGSDIAR